MSKHLASRDLSTHRGVPVGKWSGNSILSGRVVAGSEIMKNAERDESKAAKTGRRRRRRPAWKSRSGPRLIATHEAGP